MTKSEKREKVQKNQNKMGVQGMYLRKVILPLLRKRAEKILLSSSGRTGGFEPPYRGSNPCGKAKQDIGS